MCVHVCLQLLHIAVSSLLPERREETTGFLTAVFLCLLSVFLLRTKTEKTGMKSGRHACVAPVYRHVYSALRQPCWCYADSKSSSPQPQLPQLERRYAAFPRRRDHPAGRRRPSGTAALASTRPDRHRPAVLRM